MTLSERVTKTLGRGACLTVGQISERFGVQKASIQRVLNTLQADGRAVSWKPAPDCDVLWSLDEGVFNEH